MISFGNEAVAEDVQGGRNMSKAYAYRVNEIEVLPGTLGGRPKLAADPTGSTSICAAILLQGAVDVNGGSLLASAVEKKGDVE